VPYNDDAELPARVADSLDPEARGIYRESYNRARTEEGAGEVRSHKIAWGAVKNAGYSKRDGKWAKAEATPKPEKETPE
jgi:cation transport regulator ChaB